MFKWLAHSTYRGSVISEMTRFFPASTAFLICIEAMRCGGSPAILNPLHALPAVRVPNTSLIIDRLPADAPSSLTLRRVFPRLSFDVPVYMIESPDSTGRFFVLEKSGRILVFPGRDTDPSTATVTTFLDLSARTAVSNEQGLLGFDFDPAFASNGRVYVYYCTESGGPRRTVLSRFTCTPPWTGPGAGAADPASEQVLLEIDQSVSDVHKGGMIAFGPDGMLYLGTGDGGPVNNVFGRGQDASLLYGAMLRLDVRGAPDAGRAYAVPPDNPFVSGGPAGAATRPEIWAYGFRNPWRWSFDRLTGTQVVGDVGRVSWEEVNVVERGGNFGWPRREGARCYVPRPGEPGLGCETTGSVLIDPIAEYPHDGADAAITGGYVYRGSALPELYGTYVYADYVSGRIRGLKYDAAASTVTMAPRLLAEPSGIYVTAFGQDRAGELYVLDYFGGIHALVRADEGDPATTGTPVPNRLGELPALWRAGAGLDQTADGILPYTPSNQFWSDGAGKQRFVAMPGLSGAKARADDAGWDFPEGTALVKSFIIPADPGRIPSNAIRIESRLMLRNGGAWHGFSYRWREDGTDADLLTTGSTRPVVRSQIDGTTATYLWNFPDRAQCATCHTGAANHVLGLTTPEMNSEIPYPNGVTENQMSAWDHGGYFDGPLPAAVTDLPAMVNHRDPTQTTAARARAYMASNCAMCHRPGGPTPSTMDLRYLTPEASMGVVDVVPSQGGLGIAGARIAAPGDPARSVLYHRMASFPDSGVRMPPLSSSAVDYYGSALVARWIQELAPANSAVAKWSLYEEGGRPPTPVGCTRRPHGS